MMFKNKKVLVTGGTGLIGRPLVELLLREGAEVSVVSLDSEKLCPDGANFTKGNLAYLDFCKKISVGMDYIFHLAGTKGSPAMVAQKPASFFTNILMINTNMMESARWAKVKGYLYTSTIGVYPPAEVLYEYDAWKGFPSKNDWFAGWAKRMGELQAEAYRIQYDWNRVAIVRPANVYGPWDNFDPNNAMVIPSLIKKALSGANPLVVWGDGSSIRDFIHAKDVAKGMLLAMEKGLGQIINLGSGIGITIKGLVDIIVSNLKSKPQVIWDTTKPSGDIKRVMDITRARSLGFNPEITLEQGIRETMEWHKGNRNRANWRYDLDELER